MAYILFSLLLAAATLGLPIAMFPSCTPTGMLVGGLLSGLLPAAVPQHCRPCPLDGPSPGCLAVSCEHLCMASHMVR